MIDRFFKFWALSGFMIMSLIVNSLHSESITEKPSLNFPALEMDTLYYKVYKFIDYSSVMSSQQNFSIKNNEVSGDIHQFVKVGKAPLLARVTINGKNVLQDNSYYNVTPSTNPSDTVLIMKPGDSLDLREIMNSNNSSTITLEYMYLYGYPKPGFSASGSGEGGTIAAREWLEYTLTDIFLEKPIPDTLYLENAISFTFMQIAADGISKEEVLKENSLKEIGLKVYFDDPSDYKIYTVNYSKDGRKLLFKGKIKLYLDKIKETNPYGRKLYFSAVPLAAMRQAIASDIDSVNLVPDVDTLLFNPSGSNIFQVTKFAIDYELEKINLSISDSRGSTYEYAFVDKNEFWDNNANGIKTFVAGNVSISLSGNTFGKDLLVRRVGSDIFKYFSSTPFRINIPTKRTLGVSTILANVDDFSQLKLEDGYVYSEYSDLSIKNEIKGVRYITLLGDKDYYFTQKGSNSEKRFRSADTVKISTTNDVSFTNNSSNFNIQPLFEGDITNAYSFKYSVSQDLMILKTGPAVSKGLSDSLFVQYLNHDQLKDSTFSLSQYAQYSELDNSLNNEISSSTKVACPTTLPGDNLCYNVKRYNSNPYYYGIKPSNSLFYKSNHPNYLSDYLVVKKRYPVNARRADENKIKIISEWALYNISARYSEEYQYPFGRDQKKWPVGFVGVLGTQNEDLFKDLGDVKKIFYPTTVYKEKYTRNSLTLELEHTTNDTIKTNIIGLSFPKMNSDRGESLYSIAFFDTYTDFEGFKRDVLNNGELHLRTKFKPLSDFYYTDSKGQRALEDYNIFPANMENNGTNISCVSNSGICDLYSQAGKHMFYLKSSDTISYSTHVDSIKYIGVLEFDKNDTVDEISPFFNKWAKKIKANNYFYAFAKGSANIDTVIKAHFNDYDASSGVKTKSLYLNTYLNVNDIDSIEYYTINDSQSNIKFPSGSHSVNFENKRIKTNDISGVIPFFKTNFIYTPFNGISLDAGSSKDQFDLVIPSLDASKASYKFTYGDPIYLKFKDVNTNNTADDNFYFIATDNSNVSLDDVVKNGNYSRPSLLLNDSTNLNTFPINKVKNYQVNLPYKNKGGYLTSAYIVKTKQGNLYNTTPGKFPIRVDTLKFVNSYSRLVSANFVIGDTLFVGRLKTQMPAGYSEAAGYSYYYKISEKFDYTASLTTFTKVNKQSDKVTKPLTGKIWVILAGSNPSSPYKEVYFNASNQAQVYFNYSAAQDMSRFFGVKPKYPDIEVNYLTGYSKDPIENNIFMLNGNSTPTLVPSGKYYKFIPGKTYEFLKFENNQYSKKLTIDLANVSYALPPNTWALNYNSDKLENVTTENEYAALKNFRTVPFLEIDNVASVQNASYPIDSLDNAGFIGQDTITMMYRNRGSRLKRLFPSISKNIFLPQRWPDITYTYDQSLQSTNDVYVNLDQLKVQFKDQNTYGYSFKSTGRNNLKILDCKAGCATQSALEIDIKNNINDTMYIYKQYKYSSTSPLSDNRLKSNTIEVMIFKKRNMPPVLSIDTLNQQFYLKNLITKNKDFVPDSIEFQFTSNSFPSSNDYISVPISSFIEIGPNFGKKIFYRSRAISKLTNYKSPSDYREMLLPTISEPAPLKINYELSTLSSFTPGVLKNKYQYRYKDAAGVKTNYTLLLKDTIDLASLAINNNNIFGDTIWYRKTTSSNNFGSNVGVMLVPARPNSKSLDYDSGYGIIKKLSQNVQYSISSSINGGFSKIYNNFGEGENIYLENLKYSFRIPGSEVMETFPSDEINIIGKPRETQLFGQVDYQNDDIFYANGGTLQANTKIVVATTLGSLYPDDFSKLDTILKLNLVKHSAIINLLDKGDAAGKYYHTSVLSTNTSVKYHSKFFSLRIPGRPSPPDFNILRIDYDAERIIIPQTWQFALNSDMSSSSSNATIDYKPSTFYYYRSAGDNRKGVLPSLVKKKYSGDRPASLFAQNFKILFSEEELVLSKSVDRTKVKFCSRDLATSDICINTDGSLNNVRFKTYNSVSTGDTIPLAVKSTSDVEYHFLLDVGSSQNFKGNVYKITMPRRRSAPSLQIQNLSVDFEKEYSLLNKGTTYQITEDNGVTFPDTLKLNPSSSYKYRNTADDVIAFGDFTGGKFASNYNTITIPGRRPAPTINIDYEYGRTETILTNQMIFGYTTNFSSSKYKEGVGSIEYIRGINDDSNDDDILYVYNKGDANRGIFRSLPYTFNLVNRYSNATFIGTDSIDYENEKLNLQNQISSTDYIWSNSRDFVTPIAFTGDISISPSNQFDAKYYLMKKGDFPTKQFPSKAAIFDVPKRSEHNVRDIEYDFLNERVKLVPVHNSIAKGDTIYEFSYISKNFTIDKNKGIVTKDSVIDTVLPGTKLYLRKKASNLNKYFASKSAEYDVLGRPINPEQVVDIDYENENLTTTSTSPMEFRVSNTAWADMVFPFDLSNYIGGKINIRFKPTLTSYASLDYVLDLPARRQFTLQLIGQINYATEKTFFTANSGHQYRYYPKGATPTEISNAKKYIGNGLPITLNFEDKNTDTLIYEFRDKSSSSQFASAWGELKVPQRKSFSSLGILVEIDYKKDSVKITRPSNIGLIEYSIANDFNIKSDILQSNSNWISLANYNSTTGSENLLLRVPSTNNTPASAVDTMKIYPRWGGMNMKIDYEGTSFVKNNKSINHYDSLVFNIYSLNGSSKGLFYKEKTFSKNNNIVNIELSTVNYYIDLDIDNKDYFVGVKYKYNKSLKKRNSNELSFILNKRPTYNIPVINYSLEKTFETITPSVSYSLDGVTNWNIGKNQQLDLKPFIDDVSRVTLYFKRNETANKFASRTVPLTLDFREAFTLKSNVSMSCSFTTSPNKSVNFDDSSEGRFCIDTLKSVLYVQAPGSIEYEAAYVTRGQAYTNEPFNGLSSEYNAKKLNLISNRTYLIRKMSTNTRFTSRADTLEIEEWPRPTDQEFEVDYISEKLQFTSACVQNNCDYRNYEYKIVGNNISNYAPIPTGGLSLTNIIKTTSLTNLRIRKKTAAIANKQKIYFNSPDYSVRLPRRLIIQNNDRVGGIGWDHTTDFSIQDISTDFEYKKYKGTPLAPITNKFEKSLGGKLQLVNRAATNLPLNAPYQIWFVRKASNTAKRFRSDTLKLSPNPIPASDKRFTDFSIDYLNEYIRNDIDYSFAWDRNFQTPPRISASKDTVYIEPENTVEKYLYFRKDATKDHYTSEIDSVKIKSRSTGATLMFAYDFSGEKLDVGRMQSSTVTLLNNYSFSHNPKIVGYEMIINTDKVQPGKVLYYKKSAVVDPILGSSFASDIQTDTVPSRPVYSKNYDMQIDFVKEASAAPISKGIEYYITGLDFSNDMEAIQNYNMSRVLSSRTTDFYLPITAELNLYFIYYRDTATANSFASELVKLDVPKRNEIKFSTKDNVDYVRESTLQAYDPSFQFNYSSNFEVANDIQPDRLDVNGNIYFKLNPGDRFFIRQNATSTSFKSNVLDIQLDSRPNNSYTYTLDYETQTIKEYIELNIVYGFFEEFEELTYRNGIPGPGQAIEVEPGKWFKYRVAAVPTGVDKGQFASETKSMQLPARPNNTYDLKTIDFFNETTVNVAYEDIEYNFVSADFSSNILNGRSERIDLSKNTGGTLYYRYKSDGSRFASKTDSVKIPVRLPNLNKNKFSIDYENISTADAIPQDVRYSLYESMKINTQGENKKLSFSPEAEGLDLSKYVKTTYIETDLYFKRWTNYDPNIYNEYGCLISEYPGSFANKCQTDPGATQASFGSNILKIYVPSRPLVFFSKAGPIIKEKQIVAEIVFPLDDKGDRHFVEAELLNSARCERMVNGVLTRVDCLENVTVEELNKEKNQWLLTFDKPYDTAKISLPAGLINVKGADGVLYSNFPSNSKTFYYKPPEEKVFLYPNPTESNVTIITAEITFDRVIIWNSEGKKMYDYKVEDFLEAQYGKLYKNTIDLSSFPKGQYFIQLLDSKAGGNGEVRSVLKL